MSTPLPETALLASGAAGASAPGAALGNVLDTPRRPALPSAEAIPFAEIPELSGHAQLFDAASYADVPSDALLVLVRARSLSRAIAAGRYREVNAVAVAAIAAVCNAAPELDVPYVFEGDGATMLLPPACQAAAERALRAVRRLSESVFDIELCAGIVPAGDVLERGHVMRVARHRSSPHARLAAFSGGGFAAAKRWVQEAATRTGPGPSSNARYEVSAEGESEARFDGFECRWEPLPSRRGSIVSLAIAALAQDEAARAQTYRDVLRAFERIADAEACAPVLPGALRRAGFWGNHSIEARIRAQGARGSAYRAALSSVRREALLGRMLGAFGLGARGSDGARYERELCANTDCRKFAGGLRWVVDLNRAEIYRFESRLAAEQRSGRLAYGLHKSDSAIITSLVRSYEQRHLHFVDGSDGGQALAAEQLELELTKRMA